ncbi:hypothetical protein BREVNS_0511 [Brevinematales bacterium NS]|nr:hypothetical protein BREVNS_0511 [Brevinematales bacterium NS]
MKRWLAISGLLLVFVGCGPSQKPEVPSGERSGDVYRFSDRPYDAVKGVDRELYNYLFNIIRNKLIYYVLESYPQASEPFGVVLELDISGTGRGLGERRQAPAIRGWFLFERDAVPVEESFLVAYRAQNLPEMYRDLAKATFWVEKQDSESYRVFVRYWNKTVIREFLHLVKRSGGSYTIVHTEAL